MPRARRRRGECRGRQLPATWLRDAAAELPELEARAAELTARIAALRSALAAEAGDGLAGLATAVLQAARRPMTTPELATLVGARRGRPVRAETLWGSLARNLRVRMLGHGQWGLAEWPDLPWERPLDALEGTDPPPSSVDEASPRHSDA